MKLFINFVLVFENVFEFNYHEFYAHISSEIPYNNLYSYVDFSHNMEHKSQFILLIIDEYIRLHATYLARIVTIDIHSRFYGKTDQKLKHFSGQ